MTFQLTSDQYLKKGDSLNSQNEQYTLIFQEDDNLVVYENMKRPVWATMYTNSDASHAVMQADGNFVLYNNSGQAIWHSATNGHPNSTLVIQDDGNLVVYDGKIAVWDAWTDNQRIYESIFSNMSLAFVSEACSECGIQIAATAAAAAAGTKDPRLIATAIALAAVASKDCRNCLANFTARKNKETADLNDQNDLDSSMRQIRDTNERLERFDIWQRTA